MKRAPLLAACCILAISCRRPHASAAVSEFVVGSHQHEDRILRGVYPDQGDWRWTAGAFAVTLDPPRTNQAVYLEMDFTVPDEVMQPVRPVTVVASVNGSEVARTTYQRPGRTWFACQVPAQALTRRPAEVTFSTDRTFTDAGSSRIQGLILVSVGLREYQQTAEFRASEMAKSHLAYEEVLRQRDLKMPIEKQREIMTLFHNLPIWESMWFHNVRIIKNPLDLWMLQQIAWEVRPDFVIETGTWYGGSALYWAHTLNGMGLESARVLTVDIQDLTNQGASSHPLWKKYVQFFLGSSTDPKIVGRIAEQVKNRRVIINLDSDHSMHHVLQELRMYAPMVSPGSYIAVEDTHLDGVPTHPEEGPGPMAAVRQFLSEEAGKDFRQDFSREAMVMTSYPGGWLQRKPK